jgi:hypothetical protein
VLPSLPASAPHHAAQLPPTPFPHPAAAHRAPLSPGPTCQPLALESRAPCRPPLSRGNGATRAHQPGADAGRPSYPRRAQGPLSLPRLPPSTRLRPQGPLPFPSAPRTRAPSKAAGRRPRFLSSLFFFPICTKCRCLPAPRRAYPRHPPIASPPHHRKSEPLPASNPCLLGEPVLRTSWLSIGVHLTLSLLLWHCRTPPPTLLITGAPPPQLEIAALPPRRTHTSSRYSGEPSSPPPCQVHCRRPSSAHAAFPGTPCPPEHTDRPRHPAAARVATAW